MAFLTPDPRHLGRADGIAPRRDAPLPPAAKYRRWDGSQDVPDLTADEIVDALADDVLEHGDVGEALRRLMERGLRANDPSRGDLRGLRDLLDRLRERREEILRQGSLADPLADVRQELDEIVEAERTGVQQRLDSEADTAAADAEAGTPGTDPDLERMLREHRGEAARHARLAAARRRRPDPRPPGLRLHGRLGARAVRRPRRPPARQHARPDEPGPLGRREGHAARGPGGPARDGPGP